VSEREVPGEERGRGTALGEGGEYEDVFVRAKVYEGQAAAVGGVGKDLVNEPMIRHWCEAMGDTNPAYEGADATAPPTMLQAWTMGGLSGHAGRSEAYDELLGLLDDAGYTSVVATDCEQEYLRPLRPGDAITFDAVIESVSERKTTKLGTGYFVTTRMDVRVAGRPVGTHRFRILKYVPAVRRRSAPKAEAEGQAAVARTTGAAGAAEIPRETAGAAKVARPSGPSGPAPSSIATTPASGRACPGTGCSYSAATDAGRCVSPGCRGATRAVARTGTRSRRAARGPSTRTW
jgi:hypothetical protein